jgi:hypothetical protein
MTEIEIVKDDKNYDLQFTLKNYDQSVFDLTGYSLLFKAQAYADSSIKVSRAMTIVTAASGICKYTVQEGDFNLVGDYYAEIQCTKSGEIVTFTDLKIVVLPDLPR